MHLIDTHCHLIHKRLARDLPGLLDRARHAGVQTIICAAGNLQESRAAADLANREPNVYCLAGQHPHDAKDCGKACLQGIEELAGHPRNVAIGEIGLDYHYDFSPRPRQQKVFAAQLDLATRLDKKVVIHTREAFDDTLSVLSESGFPGERLVFHSCTEPAEHVRRMLDLGAMVSFSGIVTFKRTDELRRAAKIVPDDRLLIETDGPFLSPEPVRKMRDNEPANVAHVARCLAGVYGTSAEAVAETTTANARRFFQLP